MCSFARATHKLGNLITEMCGLTVLEVRSPRLRCWNGWFLPKAVRENLFQAFPPTSAGLLSVFDVRWLWHHPVSAYLHMILSLRVCLSLHMAIFFIRTLVILKEGPILLQYELILTNYILSRPYFQIRPYSKVLGVRRNIWIWGNTVQPIVITLSNWWESKELVWYRKR